MAKTETPVSNLKINRGTLANIEANLSSIGENELIITTDKNVPVPAIADSGKVVKVNGSGEYELGNVDLPTITIALSQLVSQDPIEIQLTQAQGLVLANNLQVIIDISALDFPTKVWQYEDDDSDYGFFVSPAATSGGVGFYLLQIDKSTAIATLSTAKDVEVGHIYNGSGYIGEYENYLAAGNSTTSLKMTNGLPYLTTAPSANNAEGNIKIVVLSSEPATRYNGYLYIITGSNS